MWTNGPDLDDLRTEESSQVSSEWVNPNTRKTITFVAFYEQTEYTSIEGIINIARTLFVCIVLSIASMFFTSDANRLVLNPIERMLEKVRMIAKDPLSAASDEIDNAGIHTMLQKMENKEKSK